MNIFSGSHTGVSVTSVSWVTLVEEFTYIGLPDSSVCPTICHIPVCLYPFLYGVGNVP